MLFFVPVHSPVLEGWIPDGEGEKVSVFLGLHALVADSVVLLDRLVLAEPGDLRHGVGLQDALHHQVVALLPTNIRTQLQNPFLLLWGHKNTKGKGPKSNSAKK